MDLIKVRGARTHNLNNIDVDIPRNKLVVITGLSGSGKSTLAFDTLYAEGQRRYVESLSTYARQFLERMEKPDVDLIEGLSPAIAIQQKAASHNPRSTVGTVTEIYDYIRLMYARVGIAHCHRCARPITSQSIDQMIDSLLSYPAGSRMVILAPLVAAQKANHVSLINRLKKEGYARVRVDGNILDIESVGPLPKNRKHTIEAVVDRLVLKNNISNRLADSLELAMALSSGTVQVLFPDETTVLTFSEKAVCPECAISYPEFTPASFSFNSPRGACPQCDGLGSRTIFDPELIIPNPELSLREGAVSIWAGRDSLLFIEFLEAFSQYFDADIYTPYKDLPEEFKKALLNGTGENCIRFSVERKNGSQVVNKPFEGIIPQLQRRFLETDSRISRDNIQQYMAYRPCPACKGARLRPESLAVQIEGINIHQLTSMPINQTVAFLKGMNLKGQQALVSEKIIREIIERLEFLEDVGLNYLTLNRAADTLSGGESQRIRLATQIGAKLTGVLYVLDEPSIGLHQRDNQKLLQTLKRMRDLGNTVLVVEHDRDTIESADYVVDMGPGAGINGGNVVCAGPAQALLDAPKSLTGHYLSGRLKIPIPDRRRKSKGESIVITGASHHNLKNISVSIPQGCFVCVTGVSGSGKSTLVIETLYHALAQRLYRTRMTSGKHDSIDGLSQVDKVINIDQSPIGRTPRSNPGTYTGVFNLIRDLFSRTPESRMRGYKPGRFSFNVKGGRCEACSGDGIVKIEMHFLPDVYVPCDICHGKRYNRETLEVKYKGKSITEVLEMTVNQAFKFYERVAPIRDKLQTLIEVGIGYIRLGQAATTLSGGEAQRVKLARELSRKGTGGTVYILDEPTTGLHMDDINRLLQVLNRLVDNGNTVVVIEHNLDVIKVADYIIDMGPEGGDQGGYVVGTGTPEEIADLTTSYTGRYLKPVLQA